MHRKKILTTLASVVIGLPLLGIILTVGIFYSASSCFAPNRATGSIVSSGQRRAYLLHVPATYLPTRPTPLVISLHPAALWPATQAALTHWDRLADRDGFLVVYPAGTGLDGSPGGRLPFRVWLLRPEAVVAGNIRFITDLIDTLSARYAIDPRRIYVNGFSNGAAMAFALSCRLSLRIAAVGTASAAQDQPWRWCRDTTPVPLINFHGTADLVPYTGGKTWASPLPFPSVPMWTATWAHRNHCATVPVVDTVATDVVRQTYEGCSRNAAVVLYTVQGGGHAWPGGKPLPAWLVGRTTQSVDATELMWDFFRTHPRPSP
jgi:polyhydroxybutyrate depolymerase